MARQLRGILLSLLGYSFSSALGVIAVNETTGYPCIGSPDGQVIPMNKVCDSKIQCPLHDDEYYCKTLYEHNIGEVGDSSRSGLAKDPCCRILPCLTEFQNAVEHFEIPESGRQLDVASANCSWHMENYDALRCAEDISENCPLNCTCCPLMISCNEVSWKQLIDGFKKVPRVPVRILIISNLKDPSSRNWTEMAEIFPLLRHLEVSDTLLKILQDAEFAPFGNLDVLLLNRNHITRLEQNNFVGLHNLTWLTFEENNITRLENETFSELIKLDQLSLYDNPISSWANSAFEGLDMLYTLRLNKIEITSLNQSSFNGLTSVRTLFMYNTKLRSLEAGSFHSTPELLYLFLKGNNIKTLKSGSFDGLSKLKTLSLSRSPLQHIETGAFRNLSTLSLLMLMEVTDLELNRNMFKGLINPLLTVSTDRHGVCCLVGNDRCSLGKTQPVEFTTCGDLLPPGLSVCIWIMAILAIISNIVVVSIRHRRRNETSSQNVQRILILNLALSDFLMGIYMLIIASVDVSYGRDFFWYSEDWRVKSHLCKFAGFLALLSSETSVFILTVISIDRFIILVFPFGQKRFRGNILYMTIFVIWAMWMVISVFALAYPNDELYGQSSVCIGLPFVLRDVDISGGHFITRLLSMAQNKSTLNLLNLTKVQNQPGFFPL
ncbi:uncharacterized protein [Amphiura filiformis]|uniref:uncharacterized protein n=1 Tax=Amphiura filiformis TaxID=82378 RepID=UPI003B212521